LANVSVSERCLDSITGYAHDLHTEVDPVLDPRQNSRTLERHETQLMSSSFCVQLSLLAAVGFDFLAVMYPEFHFWGNKFNSDYTPCLKKRPSFGLL